MLRTFLGWIGFALVGVVSFSEAAWPQSLNPVPAHASAQRAVLDRYCVVCHNEQARTAGLALDKMNVEQVSEGAPVWEKVLRKLRGRAMPPAGMPRPDEATYDSLANYLETELDGAAPNPGRTVLHRLNRAEYTNAIRDLLALDIDGASLLPADDSGYGFDNIGDVLSVSPMLLERYMVGARKITRLAIGDHTGRPDSQTYEVSRFLGQEDRTSGELPFGSRGGIAVRHFFPLDGDYLIKVRLKTSYDGSAVLGIAEKHQLDIHLDRRAGDLHYHLGARTSEFESKNFGYKSNSDFITASILNRITTHLTGELTANYIRTETTIGRPALGRTSVVTTSDRGNGNGFATANRNSEFSSPSRSVRFRISCKPLRSRSPAQSSTRKKRFSLSW